MRLDVLLSFQGNQMYTALQELDPAGFWRSIVVFAVLATIFVPLTLISFYIGPAADHQLAAVAERADGGRLAGGGRLPPQAAGRASRSTTPTSGSRRTSLLRRRSRRRWLWVRSPRMVTLVSFTIILWGLSGPLTVCSG